MSENVFTLTCLHPDAQVLAELHEKLVCAREIPDPGQWPAPLNAVFGEWEQPCIEKLSLRGNTLRMSLQATSEDDLEGAQFRELTLAGAMHIRCHAWYSRVGETRCTFYSAGKRSSAKSFPDFSGNDAERLLMLIEDGDDKAVAKAIKSGADFRASVDRLPLFVHIAIQRELRKSIQACFSMGLNAADCQPHAEHMLLAVQESGIRQSQKLISVLLASLTSQQAQAIWCNYRVINSLRPTARMLEGLLASGADVNAQLIIENAPVDEIYRGSLLFNSVELFEDDPQLVAVLQRHGAMSIPPPHISETSRMWRMLTAQRDADTPSQLAASGINLGGQLPGSNETALEFALRRGRLALAVALLDAGAPFGRVVEPKYFQSRLIENLLQPFSDTHAGHGYHLLLVEIMQRLLAEGLPVDLLTKATINGRRASQHFGTLLGVLPLLCPPGSALHPVVMPLSRLLLLHGADPHAEISSTCPGPNYPSVKIPEYSGFCSRLKLSHLQSAYAEGGTLKQVLLRLKVAHPEHEDVALLALFD
ncbi:hypothetical protein [Pseudomonas nicosulfuronedens]